MNIENDAFFVLFIITRECS